MTPQEKRTAIFESVPVHRAVWLQILPAIASQMITLLYNLADTYFVGLLNDPNQTAAVTIAAPPFLMLTAISNLFGVGGASLLARSLGKKEPEKAGCVASISFYGGLLCSLVFSVLFALLASPVLTLCGADSATFALTWGYARWAVVLGGPVTILNILLANLVRAEGSAATASFGVSLGGIVNILLDPIFVLPRFLGMGAEGAGLATALSNLAGTIYFLGYILKKRQSTVVRLHPRALQHAPRLLPEILSIGFPSAVQFSLTVIGAAALTNFVSGYSPQAVAGLGITKKLDQLPLFFSIGVANGLLPLLAYNHAAGNHPRRQQAFRFGVGIAVAFSTLCLVCYELFAPTLVGLFIQDGTTRSLAASFLRIMVVAMPLTAVNYPMIIQFQAMGRVWESLICSVMRKGVIDIPLLFLMDRLIPLYGCMMVQPMVDLISLTAAVWFYRRINRELAEKT